MMIAYLLTREKCEVAVGGADLLNLQHSTFATMERHVLARAQQVMRPELFARITEKLVFCRLSYDCQIEIAQLLLNNELRFLREKGYELKVDTTVLPFVVQRGFHPRLGARPMRDAVEKLVGDAVSTDLLTGGNACGQLVVEEGGGFLECAKIVFTPTASMPDRIADCNSLPLNH